MCFGQSYCMKYMIILKISLAYDKNIFIVIIIITILIYNKSMKIRRLQGTALNFRLYSRDCFIKSSISTFINLHLALNQRSNIHPSALACRPDSAFRFVADQGLKRRGIPLAPLLPEWPNGSNPRYPKKLTQSPMFQKNILINQQLTFCSRL
jgi:hypothetical protein